MKKLIVAAMLVFLLGGVARAAPPSIHVMAARMCVNEQTTPAQAFFIGIATHAMLDLTVQEYVIDWRDPDVLQKNAPAILSEMVLCTLALSGKKSVAEKWAITGALLPDIIDGLYGLANPKAWEAGLLLFAWHVHW